VQALPLIITHAILELLKVIKPLTDPANPKDAFDLVIPSMPGYGFSGRPTSTGWGPDRIARAWDVLMKRLGYKQYVSQGGDWGSVVSDVLAKQKPDGLLGVHVNVPATVPADVAKALNNGDPAPAGLSPEELAAFNSLDALYKRGSGYSAMMVTRPETVGFGLTDSPVGLAAWMDDKFAAWTYSGGDPERSLTKDEMLDDITLLLAHQLRGLVVPALLGTTPTTSTPSTSPCPPRSPCSPARSTRRPAVGRSAATTTSSTTTRSPRAGTSPRGRSP
jgi:pimeloyl-ACP methyl ester carboxylesterase